MKLRREKIKTLEEDYKKVKDQINCVCEELPSCCQAHLWHTHTQQVLLIKLQTEPLASRSPRLNPCLSSSTIITKPRDFLHLVVVVIPTSWQLCHVSDEDVKFFRDLSQTFTSFIYHSIAESRSSCITSGDSFIGRESIFGSRENWILKPLRAVRLKTQRATDPFLCLDFDDEPETWICSVQFGRGGLQTHIWPPQPETEWPPRWIQDSRVTAHHPIVYL